MTDEYKKLESLNKFKNTIINRARASSDDPDPYSNRGQDAFNVSLKREIKTMSKDDQVAKILEIENALSAKLPNNEGENQVGNTKVESKPGFFQTFKNLVVKPQIVTPPTNTILTEFTKSKQSFLQILQILKEEIKNKETAEEIKKSSEAGTGTETEIGGRRKPCKSKRTRKSKRNRKSKRSRKY